MLKIKEITIHNIALPLQETIRMSKVVIEKSNSVLVKVKSTDDISGWGEAASSLSMTGESAAGSKVVKIETNSCIVNYAPYEKLVHLFAI